MSDFNFNFEAAAERLYGGTTPTTQTAPAPQPATDEQAMAERLYGKPTPEPRVTRRDDRPMSELTEAEQAERLYGGTDPTLTHRDATQAIVNSALEDHLHDPETAGEIAAEWASTFAEHQLNATESKELADIGASALRNPPTAELLEQWTETAITNLQIEYGVQGAGQALQDARAYVASQPGLADLLDAYELGSHPKVVALAAARGRAMRLGK